MIIENIQKIIEDFNYEFGDKTKYFEVISDKVSNIKENTNEYLKNYGVYVFWNSKFHVIKVGKSCSRPTITRAFEHIRDNTHNDKLQMKELKNDDNSYLILFNLKEKNWEKSREIIHWVVALETYLENKIDPLIPSGRKC